MYTPILLTTYLCYVDPFPIVAGSDSYVILLRTFTAAFVAACYENDVTAPRVLHTAFTLPVTAVIRLPQVMFRITAVFSHGCCGFTAV